MNESFRSLSFVRDLSKYFSMNLLNGPGRSKLSGEFHVCHIGPRYSQHQTIFSTNFCIALCLLLLSLCLGILWNSKNWKVIPHALQYVKKLIHNCFIGFECVWHMFCIAVDYESMNRLIAPILTHKPEASNIQGYPSFRREVDTHVVQKCAQFLSLIHI